jgi:hypothetical protein
MSQAHYQENMEAQNQGIVNDQVEDNDNEDVIGV